MIHRRPSRLELSARFMAAILSNEGLVQWEAQPDGSGGHKRACQLIPGHKLAMWACDYADCLIEEDARRPRK